MAFNWLVDQLRATAIFQERNKTDLMYKVIEEIDIETAG